MMLAFKIPLFESSNFLISGCYVPEIFIHQDRGISSQWRTLVRYAICKSLVGNSSWRHRTKLFERWYVKVSARTIQRSQNKSFITEDDMLTRVSFCTPNLAFSSYNVKITDMYSHRNTLEYCTRTTTNARIAIPKFSDSMKFWGALSEIGFFFTYIHESLNCYQFVLFDRSLFLNAMSLFPDSWVLQQDWATTHM